MVITLEYPDGGGQVPTTVTEDLPLAVAYRVDGATSEFTGLAGLSQVTFVGAAADLEPGDRVEPAYLNKPEEMEIVLVAAEVPAPPPPPPPPASTSAVTPAPTNAPITATTVAAAPPPDDNGSGFPWLPLLILLIIALVVAYFVASRRSRRLPDGNLVLVRGSDQGVPYPLPRKRVVGFQIDFGALFLDEVDVQSADLLVRAGPVGPEIIVTGRDAVPLLPGEPVAVTDDVSVRFEPYDDDDELLDLLEDEDEY